MTESGIVSCPVNPEQPSNAEEPISVTEDGIVSCPVNPEQPENAEEPIELTPSPIVIEVNPEQP